jgi:hypothetical protein
MALSLREQAELLAEPAFERLMADTLAACVKTWNAALAERDRAVAQATVDELARLGRLRMDPATTGVVKRVVRDANGGISAIVETVEQLEPEPVR